MLQYPSPIEKELDKIRDKMWRQAGRDPDRWFAMIREKSRQVDKEMVEIKNYKK